MFRPLTRRTAGPIRLPNRKLPLLARWGRVLLALLLILSAGCSDARFLERTRSQPRDPAAAAETPAPTTQYRVGCPDVLEVAFADHPEWDALAAIDLDGRLPLEAPARVRVEGLTLEEVRAELARAAGVQPEQVRVSLAAARSGRIFLHGPVRGRMRVVPYQGPEPVMDFLKRVGGLPPGSKLNQVYVVRPQVAEGGRPQVFRVDAAAELADLSNATNIPLQASDEVYVGETRGSSLSRVMPHWLGAMYRNLVGLLPDRWWPFPKPAGWDGQSPSPKPGAVSSATTAMP